MTDPLLICAPMRIEARAIRRGLRSSASAAETFRDGPVPEVLRTDPVPEVLRTGWGTRRAAEAAKNMGHRPFGPVVIMGVGAGLTDDLKPGDLVVGTDVGAVSCGSAPLLAAELHRAGLSVRTGPITTVDHLVRRTE